MEALIALKRSGAAADRLQLRATYQGCNEPVGVCYPPIETTIPVVLSGSASPSDSSQAQVAGASDLATGASSDGGPVGQLFARGSAAYLQSPWVLGSFAAIFVLLALSMFGLYELQLPTALQSRLTDTAADSKGPGWRACS